jgi:hypothetical protein
MTAGGLPERVATEYCRNPCEHAEEGPLDPPRDACETQVRSVAGEDGGHRERVRTTPCTGLVECPDRGFELAGRAERRPNDEGVGAAVADAVGLTGWDVS